MIKNVKCIVFDLDGVLTETSAQHFIAWKHLAKRLGIKLEDSFEENLKGVSRQVSLNRILALGSKDYSDWEKAKMCEEKNLHYQKLIEDFGPENLFEGVSELFDYLKQRDIKIALASASKNAPTIINALGIAEQFDYVANPNHHPGKPAPDLFLAPIKYFGLKPEVCIGVEDASAGIEAIKKAQMHAVGIGKKTQLPAADICFDHVKRLLPYLKTLE